MSGPEPAKPDSASKVGAVLGLVVVAIILAKCAFGEDSPEEQKKAEQSCAKDDLQCIGNKGVVAAGIYCKDAIERLAEYSVKWTDGTFETKFSRFRWNDKDKGTVTYLGDKAEFQNGFGAYDQVHYECDLGEDGRRCARI